MRYTLTLILMSWVSVVAAAPPEDDYIISERDAREADSYNARRGDIRSDYDHDGTPNRIDLRDDDRYTPAWRRDYDGDGTINWFDPLDNPPLEGE